MCLGSIPIKEYEEKKCYHRADFCKYLDELASNDFWCNKYKAFIDEIEFGECKFTVKEDESTDD